MLVLTRKVGQQIVIGDSIRLTVVAIERNRIRLALSAPANTLILRKELCGPMDRSRGQESLSPDAPADQVGRPRAAGP